MATASGEKAAATSDGIACLVDRPPAQQELVITTLPKPSTIGCAHGRRRGTPSGPGIRRYVGRCQTEPVRFDANSAEEEDCASPLHKTSFNKNLPAVSEESTATEESAAAEDDPVPTANASSNHLNNDSDASREAKEVPISCDCTAASAPGPDAATSVDTSGTSAPGPKIQVPKEANGSLLMQEEEVPQIRIEGGTISSVEAARCSFLGLPLCTGWPWRRGAM